MNMNTDSRPGMDRRRRGKLAALALVLVASVGGGPRAVAQGLTTEKVDGTRAALERYVSIRRLIRKQKGDWALGKELLTDRIKILSDEIAALKKRIAEADKSIAEADKKKSELTKEHTTLATAAKSLEGAIAPLEKRVKTLLPQLPAPLLRDVELLSERIPEKPEETKLGLGHRYESVIGLLNAVNKFNRDIKTEPELRDIGGGVKASVTVMYLGLGGAYYANDDGSVAGIGVPSKKGWTWEAANEAAERIAQAIAIYKDEKVAEFVQLPLRIQ